MDKKQKIQELLTKGVENVYPTPEFLETRLNSDEKITLYLGVDPTGSSLHLGHAIVLNKLRQFQELGHKVILLIGSFTAMIGDPDKKALRKPLTREEVLDNCKNYQEQASKILDFGGENPVELKYNSDWFDDMTFKQVIELASNFTVQQMLERDMFDKRYKAGTPIYLHEFFYPLMQGYDSIAMDVDGEVGGNDQVFNMLAGRTLMKAVVGKEKFVIASKLLTDSAGVKMGKTTGNMLKLEETGEEMYGKVMSWSDGMIVNGFELCTDYSMEKVNEIKKELENDKFNPRDLKMKLAYEVVKLYQGEEKAKQAELHFINVFQKKDKPEDIIEVKIGADKMNIIEVLNKTKLVSSNGEARRVIEQGGVSVNETVITDIKHEIDLTSEEEIIIKKGKRHFVKVVV